MSKEIFFQTNYLKNLELSELKFLDLFFRETENTTLTQIIEEKRNFLEAIKKKVKSIIKLLRLQNSVYKDMLKYIKNDYDEGIKVFKEFIVRLSKIDRRFRKCSGNADNIINHLIEALKLQNDVYKDMLQYIKKDYDDGEKFYITFIGRQTKIDEELNKFSVSDETIEKKLNRLIGLLTIKNSVYKDMLHYIKNSYGDGTKIYNAFLRRLIAINKELKLI